MSPKRLVPMVAVLLAPLACGAQQEVSSVGPQTPDPAPPGAIVGPYVQAGTVFSAKLDQPLDTLYTLPGTTFTAMVTAPLQGPDGRVIVPSGARVHGAVASVGSPDAPVLQVALQSIDTIAGTLPLHAAVRSAQHVDWKGPPTAEPSASYVLPYSFTDYGTTSSDTDGSLPGRTAEGRALMQPREIYVPAGAAMRVLLIEPLVLPGAQLAK